MPWHGWPAATANVHPQEMEDATSDMMAVARTGGKPIGDSWFQAVTLSDFGAKDRKFFTTKTGACPSLRARLVCP